MSDLYICFIIFDNVTALPECFGFITRRVNSSPSGQNDHHFADDIFKCIFLNEKILILIRISLKFIPKGPIYNKWALVQVMAWHRIGDKPLPEPMLTQFTDAYMRHCGGDELRLFWSVFGVCCRCDICDIVPVIALCLTAMMKLDCTWCNMGHHWHHHLCMDTNKYTLCMQATVPPLWTWHSAIPGYRKTDNGVSTIWLTHVKQYKIKYLSEPDYFLWTKF